MMSPASMPLADFTPYLLQQTALRASLLQTSFGFAADDWDDLRQDLALDCLRRLPRFDGTRGNWKGFVHGVVRNHACVLASRQIHRHQFQPLEFEGGSELPDGSVMVKADEAPAEDFRPLLELGLDTERVLASLPEDLQRTARYLAEMPISGVRRKTGLTLSQLNLRIRRIRAAFMAAAFVPGSRGAAR
jgi:RNA polymerase sigma-70 factor (ECF subfamily)